MANRILVWFGVVLLGVPLAALAQKPPLKGGVEQSEIRRLPDGSDPYLTDGKCLATCGAAKEWLKTDYSPAERQRTSGCLSRLDSAHAHEEAMIDLIAEFDTRLGKDPRGRPYVALDVPAGPNEILPTPPERAIEVLQKKYALRVSDPRWPLERALNQLWGIPTEASITEIAAEIERSGPKALGGVFVEKMNGDGHVVAVRSEGGKAFFYDQQQGLSGSQLSLPFSKAKRFFFYRVN